jgi:hypothetical protein
VQIVAGHVLRDAVMEIVTSSSLRDMLASYGVKSITAPDIGKAKQTETTQRFKIHLTTPSGEELFTKIEFSRRGIKDGVRIETARAEILRTLRLPPLLCPHYGAEAAMLQKIDALAGRAATQARDIFDFFLLTTQARFSRELVGKEKKDIFGKAIKNIYSVEYDNFRDTVIPYFPEADRLLYDDAGRWDEIRLTVSRTIEELL